MPEGEEEYDYNIELPTVSLGSTALDVPEGGSLDDAVRAELTTVLEEGNEDYAELYSRYTYMHTPYKVNPPQLGSIIFEYVCRQVRELL